MQFPAAHECQRGEWGVNNINKLKSNLSVEDGGINPEALNLNRLMFTPNRLQCLSGKVQPRSVDDRVRTVQRQRALDGGDRLVVSAVGSRVGHSRECWY